MTGKHGIRFLHNPNDRKIRKGKGKESENWIYSLDKFIISLVSFLGSRNYQSQHQVWILYYNLQQCSHFPDNVDFSLVMLARLQEETASSILDRKQTRWGFEFSILFFPSYPFLFRTHPYGSTSLRVGYL